ncbi:hypothetical protein BG005_007940 [Podila minutissima]|nr:hypothetical protein BG005_007940 [Podila minutissima]
MDQDEYDHEYTGSDGTSTSSNYDNHPSVPTTKPSPSSTSSNKAKGKLFQCTGFGDCRMVFTRSEHLARHARKHTGEKPFKCVVEGCSRMFSRFDNMVQHTQTHTKGAHPDFSEGIAHKIALETRRKSEAGLITPSRTSRAAKRASHGSPSKEVSMPVSGLKVDVSSSSMAMYTPSSQSPLLASSASPSSPVAHDHQVKHKRSSSKKSAKQNQGHIRTGSLEAPARSHPAETWYASKLHHRPSLDYGLDMYARRNRGLDAHLPPMNYPQGPHPLDTFVPHPLSLEGSPMQRAPRSQGPYPVPQYHRPSDLSENTLPPLRSVMLPPEQTRLPSIAGRFRSQSINFDYAHAPQPEALRSRRLSLVDLEAPIQEATQAVHHSIAAPAPVKESVGVSEDEIQALEAFGELWSRGRNKTQSSQPSQHESAQAAIPGLDHGRRPVGPPDDARYGSMELDH